MDLDENERAFVIASIDLQIKHEKEEARKAKL